MYHTTYGFRGGMRGGQITDEELLYIGNVSSDVVTRCLTRHGAHVLQKPVSFLLLTLILRLPHNAT